MGAKKKLDTTNIQPRPSYLKEGENKKAKNLDNGARKLSARKQYWKI